MLFELRIVMMSVYRSLVTQVARHGPAEGVTPVLIPLYSFYCSNLFVFSHL